MIELDNALTLEADKLRCPPTPIENTSQPREQGSVWRILASGPRLTAVIALTRVLGTRSLRDENELDVGKGSSRD